MSDTKTIAEWEEIKSCIVRGDINPTAKMSEQEFDDIPPAEKQGVLHADRVKFLQANGYEITRENMMNPDLASNGVGTAGKKATWPK